MSVFAAKANSVVYGVFFFLSGSTSHSRLRVLGNNTMLCSGPRCRSLVGSQVLVQTVQRVLECRGGFPYSFKHHLQILPEKTISLSDLHVPAARSNARPFFLTASSTHCRFARTSEADCSSSQYTLESPTQSFVNSFKNSSGLFGP